MTDRTPAEQEVEARESLGDAVSHFAVFRNDDNRDMEGADALAVEDCIDAYRAAVRAARDAELAAQVERVTRYQRSRMGMDKDDEIGSWLFRADVLALFAVDAARASERAPKKPFPSNADDYGPELAGDE